MNFVPFSRVKSRRLANCAFLPFRRELVFILLPRGLLCRRRNEQDTRDLLLLCVLDVFQRAEQGKILVRSLRLNQFKPVEMLRTELQVHLESRNVALFLILRRRNLRVHQFEFFTVVSGSKWQE